MVDEVTSALPEMSIAQDASDDTPPRGTAMVKVNFEPTTLPAMLPFAVALRVDVVAVTEPEIEAPDWDKVHVILPGPVESDASPE